MELGSKALMAQQVAARSSKTLFLQNKPLAPYISNMGASPERKYLIDAARLARSPWLHSFYTDPQGYLPLRKVICENLFLSRGISCSPEQIVITCGTVQSLNLCAKLLFEEKDFIWQEAPGHVLFNTLFEFNGIRNVSVKVDDEGFSVEEGLKLNPDAKGVLVFPPSQYPMSVQMSGRRRKALLEYALSKNLWILELDTDRTPSLDNSALLPIRSMKGAESCVIYLESFSSLLYPGIKVGYMVVPVQTVQAFTGGKLLMDRNVSEINQVLVEEFLRSKEYESYIRRLTRLYRNRYAFIRKVVKEELNDFCYLNDTKSGPLLA